MRPTGAIPPAPGQESVWDYPRPPRVEPAGVRVRVVLGGRTVADTLGALRVLETSHPPVFYIPEAELQHRELFEAISATSFCEFKGSASYLDAVVDGRRIARIAWRYLAPTRGYEAIAGHWAFYPGKVDAAFVDDERVQPQAGGFYGGWITSRVTGPFKGEPGTSGW